MEQCKDAMDSCYVRTHTEENHIKCLNALVDAVCNPLSIRAESQGMTHRILGVLALSLAFCAFYLWLLV
jgi:hypothetical protein